MKTDAKKLDFVNDPGPTEELSMRDGLDYALIFNAVANAMAFTERNSGRILDVNSAWIRATGIGREESIGRTALELGVWANPAERQACYAALEKAGRVVYFEAMLNTKSADLPHLVSAQCMEIGRKRYVIWEFRDISELKQLNKVLIQGQEKVKSLLAESEQSRRALSILLEEERRTREALRLSESRIKSISDNLTAGMIYQVVVHPNGTRQFTYLSDSVRKLYGISPEKGMADAARIYAKVHKEDIQSLLEAENEAAKSGSAFKAEIRIQDPSGEVRWSSFASIPRKMEDGSTCLDGMEFVITERKRAEEALRASQQIIEGIINAIPVRVFWKDKNLVYLGCNTIFARDAGFADPKDLIGKDDYQMGWRDQAESYRADDRQVIESGRSKYLIEEPQTTPEGQIITLLTSKMPLRSSNGKISGVLGTYMDITERKRAEEALRRSEARFRALVENAPDAIVVLDSERGMFVDFNDNACRLYQLSREEMLTKGPIELSPPFQPDGRSSAESALEKLQQAIDGESPRFEWTHRNARGVDIPCEINLTRLPSANDDLIRASIIDISERKRAEEYQHRLATAVEQAAETIVITDTHGTILYANPAFEKITGYTRAEALGQNPRILKSGNHDGSFYRRMWDVLMRGESWHGHFINRRKDSTLYEEEATISPVRDSAGQVTNYVAVKRDMTREVQLESQLQQAQKMEAIGQLAGGVAHDFNNILAATMMRLDLLKTNPNLDPEIREDVRELESEAKRAASLTRQLLMFSRRSVLEIRVLDLNEAVANLLKMLGRLLGEHITLVFARSNTAPCVEADAGMLEQVLMNLSVNARDAMPRGGRITLATETVEMDPEQAAANPQRRPGRFVCLSVSDTGCGMDEVTLQRIFEPFFTTKEVGKGTGLGLATVHGIAAQHHGWVEVESRVGQGTTFRVYLPASAKAAEEVVKSASLLVSKGQETLLVVEDDASVRQIIVQSLRVLGYRVFEAANGQEAMTLWRDHGRQIDLLLTDMVMPEGITGLELAEMTRAEKPGLKVIISSGYSAGMVEHGKITDAAIVYLPKPYRASVLGETVRECLDRK